MYHPYEAVKEVERLDVYFKMKSGSIGDPDIYLRENISDIEIVGNETT